MHAPKIGSTTERFDIKCFEPRTTGCGQRGINSMVRSTGCGKRDTCHVARCSELECARASGYTGFWVFACSVKVSLVAKETIHNA